MSEKTESKTDAKEERKTKLAVLRALAEEREAARAEARELAELEGLELECRFEKELGPKGQSFAIVDASELGEGFIVVKLGEEVLWKKYKSSKMEPGDTHDFVYPCVAHPSRERYVEIVARRPFLAERSASALATLYGVKLRTEEGKF